MSIIINIYFNYYFSKNIRNSYKTNKNKHRKGVRLKTKNNNYIFKYLEFKSRINDKNNSMRYTNLQIFWLHYVCTYNFGRSNYIPTKKLLRH